ncbi:MAG: type II toxin-antitoxin system RelE/ParE family toxin [Candidatus Diapherotrites archaeon]|nr:type II toxin-antitoxin system RelE/ParE family toxin [Candidatus Diapherotrites archaeon]
MFDVRLSRDAEKFYERSDNRLKDRLKELFAILTQNPVPVYAHDVKKMRGRDDEYRIRLSRFRVIYRVDWDNRIIRIGVIERRDEHTYD